MFLSRELDSTEATLSILKARSGRSGWTIPMVFNPERLTFFEDQYWNNISSVMFDNIINKESYPYSKRRLKYYSLVFKDAEHKIINGVNPEDVHKNLIKDLNRLQSRN